MLAPYWLSDVAFQLLFERRGDVIEGYQKKLLVVIKVAYIRW